MCRVHPRWWYLALASFMVFSVNYCTDIPEGAHTELKVAFTEANHDIDFESFFGLMYSIFFFPNILFSFIAGVTVSKFGATPMSVTYTGLSLFGAVLVTIGIWVRCEALTIFARALFGLGAESQVVAISTAVVTHFKKTKQTALALAIGLQIVPRVATIIVPQISVQFAQKVSLLWAFGFGDIMLACAFIGSFVFWWLETHVLRLENSTNPDSGASNQAGTTISSETSQIKMIETCNLEKNLNDGPTGTTGMPVTVTGGDRDAVQDTPAEEAGTAVVKTEAKESIGTCTKAFASVTAFPLELYMLAFSIGMFYAAIFGFFQFGSAILVEGQCGLGDMPCCEHSMIDSEAANTCDLQLAAENSAARIMVIPFLVSTVLGIPVAALVDKTGKGQLLAFVASALLSCAFAVLVCFDTVSPTLGITISVLFGITYATFGSSAWPLVFEFVPGKEGGIAMGMVLSIQNLILSLSPVIAVQVSNAVGRFASMNYFFFALSITNALNSWAIMMIVQRRRRLASSESKAAGGSKEQTN